MCVGGVFVGQALMKIKGSKMSREFCPNVEFNYPLPLQLGMQQYSGIQVLAVYSPAEMLAMQIEMYSDRRFKVCSVVR